MQWIHDYQLFLFDLDGLLVNTEEIHYQAYQQMCEKYGFKLDWTFKRYCDVAHYSASGLKEEIYRSLPELQKAEPDWDVLYAYKKEQVVQLLELGVKMMPGVKKLLQALQKAKIKSCVVTHSPHALVNRIRSQHDIFDTIPYWITREQYALPKPHPDGYQIAIQQFGTPQINMIGFEDTPRGIEALLKTRAKPVLISKMNYKGIPKNVVQFHSFNAIPNLF